LALYDRGQLVKYYRPEEIWKAYRDLDCFVVMIPSPPLCEGYLNEESGFVHLTTQERGPAMFGGYPKWYHEEYTIDLRTGEILSVSIVDWIERALWIAGALIAGWLRWWIIGSRRKRARARAET